MHSPRSWIANKSNQFRILVEHRVVSEPRVKKPNLLLILSWNFLNFFGSRLKWFWLQFLFYQTFLRIGEYRGFALVYEFLKFKGVLFNQFCLLKDSKVFDFWDCVDQKISWSFKGSLFLSVEIPYAKLFTTSCLIVAWAQTWLAKSSWLLWTITQFSGFHELLRYFWIPMTSLKCRFNIDLSVFLQNDWLRIIHRAKIVKSSKKISGVASWRLKRIYHR